MNMRSVLSAIGGFVAGGLVGLLATVVHAGPLDMPVIGLLLSCAIVVSGSWFVLESGWVAAWLGAALGVCVATIWLITSPLHDDSFVSTSSWVSNAWLFLAPLSAVLPALWVSKGRSPNEN